MVREKTGQSLFKGRFSVEEVNKPGNEISNTACAPKKNNLINEIMLVSSGNIAIIDSRGQ